jgi:uncharacterized tellurite resistance protein B-like protein
MKRATGAAPSPTTGRCRPGTQRPQYGQKDKGRIVGLEAFPIIGRIFRGKAPSDQERQELFKEALLLTLARATRSDVNISPVEIESVQEMMKTVAGEDVSEADVRVAAHSELYEQASLKDYLGVVGRKLLASDRSRLLECVAEVIRSDRKITTSEIEFFNSVVSWLGATPSDVAGLVE